ncbi:DUF4869 domain-containing protein [uncultured Selenomonas sp.]|uniref:DUF4869 domain-containing protein n=1 Tax=uncultured Selenomonas sp. TaxID=159275 RepID=UPI0025E00248|nr:DUF4869 domain-containing protein [uncultured Selenomonas sp.]
MLHVFYGPMDGVVMKPSVYFKNTYQPEWLLEPWSKKMIHDVDRSEVVGPNLIQSPVLGPIPPERLSGGVKTLILIWQVPEKIFNASNCGDNCAAWLLKMGEERDVTINLRHLLDFGETSFEIEILNTGDIVHSMKELVPIAGDFV